MMSQSNKVRPIGKKEVLSQGRFLRFVAHEYFDRFGMRKQWESVERICSTNIVMLFAVTKAKEVILVKQYRFPIGKEAIELPAGGLDRQGGGGVGGAPREFGGETRYAGGPRTARV